MRDLFQLRCFVAVCEELHFGKAAVRLTAAGESLYRDALKLLRLADEAATSARLTAQGDSGRVVVGYTAVAGYRLIPRLLRLARQALPGIDIVLEEMVSAEQFKALAGEALDLAFVRPLCSDADLLYHCIVREPMVLALPAEHPLAAQDRVALADVEGQPLVMYSEKEGKYFHDKIKALFIASGVRPHYVHHIGQTHTIMALVQAGIGIAIVPASASHLPFGNVRFRALWRPDVVAEIYLAWRRAERNPAQRRLREFIVEALVEKAPNGVQAPGR